jgi:4-amino-4-deoxy-L-arabinose transferase-like glycosyltransferase
VTTPSSAEVAPVGGSVGEGAEHPQTAAARPSWRRRAQFWLSPPDQPGWARPAVLGLAVISGFVYAWGAGNYLEIYYAAAVRSMSMSWHDFFFGAFDPAGTMSLDKLPGSFWVQALAVRLFGVHPLAVVLPQVIEGALTVLVLYRAVRRLAGPIAGILAAGALVISPATVALNRGNIPDTLMILLLTLAADAAIGAITSGRASRLLVAGLLVGLAFQAKMIEAWLLLPALALVYLLAGAGPTRKRLLAAAAMVLVAVVVSLGWMAVVSLTPASQRPYVDGSTDNSVWQQVFVYNGFGRIDEESPDQQLQSAIGIQLGKPTAPGWNRLLTGALGLDVGWLVPSALVALAAGLIARRRESRRDLVRVGFLLWGTWLLPFAVVFSAGSTVNSYYMGDLSPPICALAGSGLALAWQYRESMVARAGLAVAVMATAAYGAWLLPSSATGLPAWLKPAVIVVGVLAATGLLIFGRVAKARSAVGAAFVACALAIALAPASATGSIVADHLGPFDTPFQPPMVTTYIWQVLGATPKDAALTTLPLLEKVQNHAPYLMATETSALAAPFIFYSGRETLPIGGFTGTIPSPTLPAIEKMVAHGDFHLVLESPKVTDPRLVWIVDHCVHLGLKKGAGPAAVTPTFAIYYCLPSSVRSSR